MRKGADCLSKWVGEAERQLRLLFEQARRHQVRLFSFFFRHDQQAVCSVVTTTLCGIHVVKGPLGLLELVPPRWSLAFAGQRRAWQRKWRMEESVHPLLRKLLHSVQTTLRGNGRTVRVRFVYPPPLTAGVLVFSYTGRNVSTHLTITGDHS